MRTVFLGNPRFAVPTLQALAASQHHVAAVVTNPDRPQGRGRRAAATPVDEAARALGLPVFQPESVTDPELPAQLQALQPDAFVVVAFSILPPPLLAVPRLGSVNLHPSLLPRYRGAAPVIWAVVRGETRTGITTFRLDPRVDAGDILLQTPVDIHPEETAGELEERLSRIGAQLMVQTLDGLDAGQLQPQPQPRGKATRAPKVSKEDGRIRWQGTTAAVHNHIRGFTPVPGAFTVWRGRPLKVHRAAAAGAAAAADGGPREQRPPAGTILQASPTAGLVVATVDGALRLTQVQLEGGRCMDDGAFLRGHDVAVGEQLGP